MNSDVNSQKDKLRDLINGASSIGIIVGQGQNLDAYAAALGLFLTLRAEGKSVQIVSRETPTVEVSNLFGIDKITHSFEGQTKILTISAPYREGEIEKVSYNIEGDRLNVNLFAEGTGITFSEKDIQYIRKGSSPSLIITIGVQSEAEITNFADPKSVKTIHIDRNLDNSLMGDVVVVNPSFTSFSEIITQMILDLSLFGDVDAYQNLMDGIAYATRNFTLPQTSPYAFESAGFLLQNGAKRKQKDSTERQNRDANFPNAEHFLNQRPEYQQKSQQKIQDYSQRPQVQAQKQPRPEPIELPSSEAANNDFFDDNQAMTKAAGESENAPQDEIPEDWFLPKVFKGSKKGN